MSNQPNEKYDVHFVGQLIDAAELGLYWKNREGEVLGCNRYMLDLFGVIDKSAAIGKFESASFALAEHQTTHDIDGRVLSGAPYKDIACLTINDHKRSFLVTKAALRSTNGAIVGIIAAARDITELEENIEFVREKATLELNAELKHAAIDQQIRVKKIVDQIVHDIRSPLSSMLMILQVSRNLPERERKSFSVAVSKINEVTGDLLRAIETLHPDYRQEAELEDFGSLLVSPIVLRVVVDKKYEYQRSLIHYECHFTESGSFAWIEIASDSLITLLSCLIDFAVARFENDVGCIRIQLDASHDAVSITIEDNGQNVAYHHASTSEFDCSDSEEVARLVETVRLSGGTLTIEPQPGIGTRVVLSYPRVRSHDWIAQSIELREDDTILVLDDDMSVHTVWSERMRPLLHQYPDLKLEHFESAQAAVDFVHAMPEHLHGTIFILTNYELLNQSMSGLDVIENTGNPRAVLITNRYNDLTICQRAVRIAATVLPKQLARIVPIVVTPACQVDATLESLSMIKSAAVIFVDDDRDLLETFTLAFGQQVQIDTYSDPKVFLESVGQYQKDAKIFLDYQFKNFDDGGIQLALRLHAMKFTRIFLLTGMEMEYFLVPDFLTVISKIDISELIKVLKS